MGAARPSTRVAQLDPHHFGLQAVLERAATSAIVRLGTKELNLLVGAKVRDQPSYRFAPLARTALAPKLREFSVGACGDFDSPRGLLGETPALPSRTANELFDALGIGISLCWAPESVGNGLCRGDRDLGHVAIDISPGLRRFLEGRLYDGPPPLPVELQREISRRVIAHWSGTPCPHDAILGSAATGTERPLADPWPGTSIATNRPRLVEPVPTLCPHSSEMPRDRRDRKGPRNRGI